MIHILLLDQDRYYTRQVCAKINSLSVSFHCFDYTDYPFRDAKAVIGQAGFERPGGEDSPVSAEKRSCCAVELGLLGIEWDSTLVIYHPQQYRHPPGNSYTMILLETKTGIPGAGTSIPDSVADLESDFVPASGLYKYCSAGEMRNAIESYLVRHSGLSAMDKKPDLMCVLGTACTTRRLDPLAHIYREKLEQGMKMVQIDFCPPYFINRPRLDSVGYTMTDAFLRILADDFSFEDLGVFLAPGADGVLYFRPVERADDLFEPDPDHVRKFMESVRKWILHTNSQYFVVVQCYAVPFAFINSIAVVCDELLLVNQEGASPQNISYNRELAHLLANLPASCKVQEISVACPAGNQIGHGRILSP